MISSIADNTFSDKAAIRDYFTQLTGSCKDLNYSQDDSSSHRDYLAKIIELANSQVK
jgi:hypothetical protein